jgi:serine/threonine protein kinase
MVATSNKPQQSSQLRKFSRILPERRQRQENYVQTNSKQRQNVPIFDPDEIIFGSMLGRGSFNTVYSLHAIDLDQQVQDSLRDNDDRRIRLSSEVIHNPNLFAVKMLSVLTLADNEILEAAACDLASEAKLLSNLSHPNIIRLHGLCIKGICGLDEQIEGPFFLILDRMQCTLEDELLKWQERGRKPSFEKRLHYASRISSALSYLHSMKILHRDIKPDNIAFDLKGELKLIDFGLSAVLDDTRRLKKSKLYRLTAKTGSPAYWSPENSLGLPYGLSSDVYSFSVVLYEILTGTFSFQAMDKSEHHDRVILGGLRPQIPKNLPKIIQSLLWCGWSTDLDERPSMNVTHRVLKQELKTRIGLRKQKDSEAYFI